MGTEPMGYAKDQAEKMKASIAADTRRLARDERFVSAYSWLGYVLAMIAAVVAKPFPAAAALVVIAGASVVAIGALRLGLARSRVSIGMDWVCNIADLNVDLVETAQRIMHDGQQAYVHAKQLHNELSRRQGLPIPYPDVEPMVTLSAN